MKYHNKITIPVKDIPNMFQIIIDLRSTGLDHDDFEFAYNPPRDFNFTRSCTFSFKEPSNLAFFVLKYV